MRNSVNSLASLESHLDGLLANLHIFGRPLQDALRSVLSLAQVMYVSSTDASSYHVEDSVRNVTLKKSLELLIPQLYKVCPVHVTEEDQSSVESKIMDEAIQAIEFFKRFHDAELAFSQYHMGRFNGEFSGRTATFSYHGADAARSANLSRALRFRMERKSNELRSSEEVEEHQQAIRDVIDDVKRGGRFDFELIKTQLIAQIQETTVYSTHIPTISPDTSLGSYTIEEAYRVWMGLKALAIVHQIPFICFSEIMTSEDVRSILLMNRSIEQLKLELEPLVSVPSEKVGNILEDLVLNPEIDRPDMLIRPLYPLPGKDKLIIAPFVLDTADWETCLLRNQATNNPGTYGSTIAPQKVKPLPDELAKEFTNRGFKAATRRILRDSDKCIIGDVDVAVIDVENRHISLLEIKWPISPDSVREDSKASEEIENGRNQLARIADTLHSHPSEILSQLFPDLSKVIDFAEFEVSTYVVSKDFLGFDPLIREPYVLDYDLVLESLQSGGEASLSETWGELLASHQRFAPPEMAFTTKSIQIGGYLLKIPAFHLTLPATQESEELPKQGRNEPCQCGSGLKYKKCCLDAV